MNRIMFSILSVLDREGAPLGSSDIASRLVRQGTDLSERTIRYYLKRLDEAGYTVTDGKKGRRITAGGRAELRQGYVSDRVGFIINRINNLAFLSDFGPDNVRGKVILNVTFVPEERLEAAIEVLGVALRSPYSMSERAVVVRAGEHIGTVEAPAGTAAIGTMCSITLNGMFLKRGIPIATKLGGLVEVVDGRSLRFTSVISYEGSSVPPLEILMRSRMSDVLGAVEGGSGLILGSYREIPENSVSDAKDLLERMAPHGFGGIVLFGSRGEPLLGISPTDGKVGIVVLGGLNVNAALEQAGVGRGTQAMATLCDYPLLSSIEALERAYLPRKEESSLFLRYLSRTRQESDDGYWSVLRALKQMTF